MESAEAQSAGTSLGEFYAELKRLEKLLQEMEEAGNSCNATTSKLTQNTLKADVDGDKDWNKLLKNYRETKSALIRTDRSCGICIEKLRNLLDKGSNKRKMEHTNGGLVALKRFKGTETFTAQHALAGKQVAARISKDRETPEEWILASIVRYIEEEKRYEVEDEDPGDEDDPNPVRRHYKLSASRLIVLRENPTERKEFAKASEVLAMFPDTTSFYPATVIVAPKKKHNDYILQFADDDDESGLTPQRRIKPKYVVLKTDTLDKEMM